MESVCIMHLCTPHTIHVFHVQCMYYRVSHIILNYLQALTPKYTHTPHTIANFYTIFWNDSFFWIFFSSENRNLGLNFNMMWDTLYIKSKQSSSYSTTVWFPLYRRRTVRLSMNQIAISRTLIRRKSDMVNIHGCFLFCMVIFTLKQLSSIIEIRNFRSFKEHLRAVR